ncbi:signal peptidase I [Mediterraneibacter sp.]|jgi:signal peptidase I|uniref:signal peptidase I n=1 Tax=Mediterraneibacter sp. TaxID=2316022 RepID=UPI0015AE9A0B|nr:signal peptidase I [Mediterraneibacter sp.]
MGELDFRKKRKNTNVRGAGRKQGKSSKQRELRFENEKREKRSSGKRWGRNRNSAKGIVLWAVELLLVCMTAVFLVAAFGQRVNVIGDSMSPVLKNGNVVMINHFIYNIKNPSRGDIAAFQKDGGDLYSVKRIVGLPGETVQIKEGELLINGKPLKEEYASDIGYAGTASEPVKLGKEEYFFLGDNDTASDDSREKAIGKIKKKDIYGKVWFVIKPWSEIGFVSD